MLVEFEASVPYVAATIELAEQPGLFLVANIVGQPPDQVEIGQPVRVIFEEAGDGVVLAQFTPHEDRP